MTISLLKEKSNQSTSSFNLSNLNGSNSNITPIVISGIVFIDPKVDDYELLMAGVKPGLEVVLLDGSHSGIAQITQALKGRRCLSNLHIVAHGEAGKLWLGKEFVDSSTLSQESDQLKSWAGALAPDADILLYGCNVAFGFRGQQFVQLFSQLTGADVAASNNLTGSAALGGDWELEVKIGQVKAPLAFRAETLDAYSEVLTTTRVSVASDGTQGRGASYAPSISADGRYVAFESSANNLVSGDTNNAFDIFVYDTVANTTRRVSVGDNATQGNSGSYAPSISADGRYVAFESGASNLVSGDTNGTWDIFVYDTVANTTRRVSVASNLVSGDTNNAADIFLYDRGDETQNPWTGTPGNDTYTYTGTANFTGSGLAGNDTIVGGIGNDTLDGGTGSDSLIGGRGNDKVYGRYGNDTLLGEQGSDLLSGGNGNDLLVGYGNSSGEIDTLVGGSGADTFGIGVNFAHFGGTGGLVGYTRDGNAGMPLFKTGSQRIKSNSKATLIDTALELLT